MSTNIAFDLSYEAEKNEHISIIELRQTHSRVCDCDSCLGRSAFEAGFRIEELKSIAPELVDGFVGLQEETGKEWSEAN